MTTETWDQNYLQSSSDLRGPRVTRSISKDPPAAYFFQPEEAYRAADQMERRQIQILVIQN